MKKSPRRRLWLALLLLLFLVPVGYGSWLGYQRYLWWDAFERPVVNGSFKVALPDGGFATYRNQSPRQRLLGPADSEKYLLWQRPDGRTQDYLISSVGADYRDIEFRLRADGKALWAIAWDQHKLAATLDLQTGDFTDGGGFITQWGAPGPNDSGPEILPKWAKLGAGRSLGRKKLD